MTDRQTLDTSQQRNEDSDGTLQRRKFLAASCGAGVTMFAGCASESDSDGGSSDDSSDDTGSTDGSDGTGTDSGSFRLLISDMPADIGDFDRLDVSFDRARIFEGGGGSEDGDAESDADGDEINETEENATSAAQETGNGGPDGEEVDEEDTEDDGDTDEGAEEGDSEEDEKTDADSADDGPAESTDGEGQGGFYNLDLDGATVDLTQVVDDRAISVFDGELSKGRYSKIELYVADIEGIVGGEVAEVKVPSGKLQITQPFEVVAGESVEFVFDINVVKRGQALRYNLTPVISESGVRGEDVDVEEVDDEGEGGDSESDKEESDDESDDGDETEIGEDGGGGQNNESGEQ